MAPLIPQPPERSTMPRRVTGHMGDTPLVDAFSQRDHYSGALVQRAERHRPQMQVPGGIADWLEADPLARHRLADEDVLPVPLHRAVGPNLAHFKGLDVLEDRQRHGHRPRRRGVHVQRRAHVERLMWTLVVVAPSESVECGLLRAYGRSRRFRGFVLQCPVEAFVPPVLLRMPGLNEDWLDTQTQQPNAEAREPAQPTRPERRTVVAEHRTRQAQSPEHPLEPVLYVLQLRRDHRAAFERGPTEDVVDRQRVTARAVTDLEPTLVVDRPHIVGRVRFDHGCRLWRTGRSTTLSRPNDASPIEHAVNRATRWEVFSCEFARQHRQDLLRPPCRVGPAHPQDGPFHLGRGLIGVLHGGPRAITKPLWAVLLVPLEELVAGLAADPEANAQVRHGLAATLRGRYELQSLVHGVGFLPGHPGRVPPQFPAGTDKCYPCARTQVSPMYPGRTVSDAPCSFITPPPSVPGGVPFLTHSPL